MKDKLFTDINIARVGDFVSHHQKFAKNIGTVNSVPPFSSVEISINGACNRRCFFCPRVDEKEYPNILNSLNLDIYESLIKDLEKINYNGRLSFSGFCEPLLTKNLHEYIKIAKKKTKGVIIEIVTNGDPILAKNGKIRLKELFDSGLDNLRVSLYDGPHQVEKFDNIKKELNLSDKQLILRKRYLGPEESFGMTISNRAGSVSLKNKVFELKPLSEPLKQPCFYPFYKVLIDHDGSVLMCSNDWKKEKPMGNIFNSSLIDIWSNEKFVDLRKKLFNKDRNHKPCNVCDVNGMLNGKDAFKKWESYFSKQIKNK